jgi:hypothetical protein
MNQSRIADIDRYDTGLQVANATLIQSSPALRNCRMLIVAMAKYLLVELYGEVASLCSQISNYIHLGRLDCMRNGLERKHSPRWSSHRDVQPLGHRDL